MSSTLIVIPLSRSSVQLSISEYALKMVLFKKLKYLVIAADKVVLPWSTCPIVPIYSVVLFFQI